MSAWFVQAVQPTLEALALTVRTVGQSRTVRVTHELNEDHHLRIACGSN